MVAWKPAVSFAACVTNRSAWIVRLIHVSTLARNEWIMTDTPTVMATAAMSAAMVRELRCIARTRLREARRHAVPRGRCETRRDKALPASAVAEGTRKANPVRTKNAAAKPSCAGPVCNASHDEATARARHATPQASQRRVAVL